MKKYLLISTFSTFLLVFNLGYVFHDLLMGNWLHEKEALISRNEYIIPAIAISFLFYVTIQAVLLPVFYFFSSQKLNWGIYKTGIIFGGLLGFLWDALQGGLIEYATFKMPIEVFFVDSGFHLAEGMYTGLFLAYIYKKLVINKSAKI